MLTGLVFYWVIFCVRLYKVEKNCNISKIYAYVFITHVIVLSLIFWFMSRLYVCVKLFSIQIFVLNVRTYVEDCLLLL
jgi:hypothetical protein